ncbi:hypothetical protein L2E82_46799 [Cichorium intybus]|uniref:Uncharacterized protein n=1 Tax=Cichorium intybus TaxID=13427 RepID=A0ACB8YVB0_CICIN|nr:hypothetical protein L2E82_46799 [Cichorium intybus]
MKTSMNGNSLAMLIKKLYLATALSSIFVVSSRFRRLSKLRVVFVSLYGKGSYKMTKKKHAVKVAVCVVVGGGGKFPKSVRIYEGM